MVETVIIQHIMVILLMQAVEEEDDPIEVYSDAFVVIDKLMSMSLLYAESLHSRFQPIMY